LNSSVGAIARILYYENPERNGSNRASALIHPQQFATENQQFAPISAQQATFNGLRIGVIISSRVFKRASALVEERVAVRRCLLPILFRLNPPKLPTAEQL